MTQDGPLDGSRGAQATQRARHQQIAEAVIKRGSMRIEQLAKVAGVSVMTIYRDVAALEEAGVITRHRGLVTAVASSLNEASASFRLEQQAASKASMAAALAPLIGPGSSILLDDSTSGVWLVRALADVPQLSVVTNSMLVCQEIAGRDDVRLHVVGGEYQPWAEALIGASTIRMIDDVQADFCVVSTSGVVGDRLLHPYEDVASVKRAMVGSATTRVLMADHTKFLRSALHSFAHVADFDVVVVDAATPERTREEILSQGVRLVVSEG